VGLGFGKVMLRFRLFENDYAMDKNNNKEAFSPAAVFSVFTTLLPMPMQTKKTSQKNLFYSFLSYFMSKTQ